MDEHSLNTTEVIAIQQQLFKIEHTASSRPGSLVELESPSTVEPNPAQPDMFGVEYFK